MSPEAIKHQRVNQLPFLKITSISQGLEISEPYFGDQTTWIKGVADKAKNLAKRRLNTNDATMPVTEAISMTNGAVFWRMLLTSLKDGHYSYKGSLTTPGRPNGVLIHWQNSYSKLCAQINLDRVP